MNEYSGFPCPEGLESDSSFPIDEPMSDLPPRLASISVLEAEQMMDTFGFVHDRYINGTSNSYVYRAIPANSLIPPESDNFFTNYQSEDDSQSPIDNSQMKIGPSALYEPVVYALKFSTNKARLLEEYENSQKILFNEWPDFEFRDSLYLVKVFDIFEGDNFSMLQMEMCQGGDLLSFYKSIKESMVENDDEIDLADNLCSSPPSISTATQVFNTPKIPKRFADISISYVNRLVQENQKPEPFFTIHEPILWLILHDISCALYQIHSLGYIHLDVSPSNILISNNYFKLADFATLIEDGDFASGKEGAGPYCSPETLKNNPKVTFSTDIYSLGVVLLEAASGIRAPIGGISKKYSLLREGMIKLGDECYPTQIKGEFVDIINQMLDPNPESRPTAFELMQYPKAVFVAKNRGIVFQ